MKHDFRRTEVRAKLLHWSRCSNTRGLAAFCPIAISVARSSRWLWIVMMPLCARPASCENQTNQEQDQNHHFLRFHKLLHDVLKSRLRRQNQNLRTLNPAPESGSYSSISVSKAFVNIQSTLPASKKRGRKAPDVFLPFIPVAYFGHLRVEIDLRFGKWCHFWPNRILCSDISRSISLRLPRPRRERFLWRGIDQ